MATFDSDNEQIVGGVLRPKDAATLVIVRHDGGAPRVLMGQRHGNMAFMANKYVFPGGRIDAADMRISVSNQLKPHVAARAGHGSTPARARGLALAAIRETFEETGILLGTATTAVPKTRSEAWLRFFSHRVAPR